MGIAKDKIKQLREDAPEVGDHTQTLRARVAEVVWNTSRADEGTISATGANVVADAVLAFLALNIEAPEVDSVAPEGTSAVCGKCANPTHDG